MPAKLAHHHKNLLFLALSFLATLALSRLNFFNFIIERVGNIDVFGRPEGDRLLGEAIGAVIGGAMFVSTFTIAPAGVLLTDLSHSLSPIIVALFGGFGASLSNLVMIKTEDDLLAEIAPLFNKLGGKKISAIFKSRHFKWTLPVIGAVIIASPLPDEIGVALMGESGMPKIKFALLSFLLNAVGIFLLISVVRIF